MRNTEPERDHIPAIPHNAKTHRKFGTNNAGLVRIAIHMPNNGITAIAIREVRDCKRPDNKIASGKTTNDTVPTRLFTPTCTAQSKAMPQTKAAANTRQSDRTATRNHCKEGIPA
jgi:hypothetical protein